MAKGYFPAMFKFIHTADIHLDSPLHRLEAYEGAPRREIRQATRRALENLVDLAREESVEFIIIAGDLFDGDWQDYHTGLYFVAQMHRLKAAAIDVFIVSGNHDAASQITRQLPYPDNVHRFAHRAPETRRLENLQVALHGQSFARPAVMENLALSYPEPLPGYFNIGLLHTSLNGRQGHAPYAPCTLADLEARGYDYWALGHVHAFEVVSHEPPVVFPGCIQGRHIREAGTKGAVMVTVAGDSAPAITHQPLDVIRWVHLDVDLTDSDTRQAALDRYVTALEEVMQVNAPLPLIVRVAFSGPTPIHNAIAGAPDDWKEAIRAAALAQFGEHIWVERVMLDTRLPARAGAVPTAPGPLRELAQVMRAIQTDEDRLRSLGDELQDLFRKLPAEYRRGARAIDSSDPDHLRQLVNQAQALLIRDLKKGALEA
jgi:DNA repair exonuclease SbcCD nuclease subunit